MGDEGRTGAFLTIAGIGEASTSLGMGWSGLGPTRFGSAQPYTLLAALDGPLRAKTGPQRADLRPDGHYQQRLDLACLIPTTDGLTARFAR
jgi:hypothetical protein